MLEPVDQVGHGGLGGRVELEAREARLPQRVEQVRHALGHRGLVGAQLGVPVLQLADGADRHRGREPEGGEHAADRAEDLCREREAASMTRPSDLMRVHVSPVHW